MSLFNRSHSGARTQDVSRQFTESERVIDDRIDSQVQSPMPEVYASDITHGYSWLEEDLKRRAAITGILSQEQDMANQQSVRRELDNKFTQDTTDEADAIQASKEMNALFRRNPNMTHEQAVTAVTNGREDRWGNDKFLNVIEKTNKMRETDLQKQKREGDLSVSIIANEFGKITGSARRKALETPEGQDFLNRHDQLLFKKEMAGFPLTDQENELKQEKMKFDLKEQKMRTKMFESFDPSFQGKAAFVNLMDRAGLPVNDVEASSAYMQANPDLQKVVAHPTFLSRYPDAAKALGGAMEIIQSPTATPEEKKKAEVDIYRVTGAHSQYTAQSEYKLKLEEKAQEFGAVRGKSLGALHKDISELTTKKAPDKPAVPIGEEAVSRYESWTKQHASERPEYKTVYDKYAKKFDEARKAKDDKTRVNIARDATDDFAMEIAELDEVKGFSSTKEKSSSPGKKIATRATAAEYRAKANGDIEKAKQMMLEDGYTN